VQPKTVLITGCSSGIGRATALAFAEEGWTVYATARDPDDIEPLADAGCKTAALDVTDPTDIDRVVNRILDEDGVLSCLVNNAGYGQFGPVEDVPTEKIEQQYAVNVYGPHRLIKAVLPHMRREEDGTIINISSVAGRVAFPGGGVYCGSKFAIEGMSDALRAEVEPFDIDVVVIEPGPVKTGFTERAGLRRSTARELTRSFIRCSTTPKPSVAAGPARSNPNASPRMSSTPRVRPNPPHGFRSGRSRPLPFSPGSSPTARETRCGRGYGG